MISCANISNQEVVETSKEIGFDKTEGVKTSLFGGNMETVAVW